MPSDDGEFDAMAIEAWREALHAIDRSLDDEAVALLDGFPPDACHTRAIRDGHRWPTQASGGRSASR